MDFLVKDYVLFLGKTLYVLEFESLPCLRLHFQVKFQYELPNYHNLRHLGV